MRTVIILAILAAMLGGCASSSAPAAQPTTLTLSGTSDKATDMFPLRAGLARFEIEYAGRSGPQHFSVWLMNSKGENETMLASALEPYKGSKATEIKAAGKYLLNVSADGPWKVTVNQ